MSEVIDFLSIAERRTVRGAAQTNIMIGSNEFSSEELSTSLDEIKDTIANIICGKEVDISHHQQFIRSIHGSLQAGKPNRTIDYFVLNYDTLLEDALGLEKVAFVDGFAGAATGWWDPTVFNDKKSLARVFKIHGSIEWSLLQGDPLPRKVRGGIKCDTRMRNVIIYPASTKYQETQRDPFAQLMQIMRSGLLPSEGKEIVLAICGYSFYDSHINLEIENALHQSDGRLTVAAFISGEDPMGALKTWIETPNISEQIRVYSNKAFIHGETVIKLDKELPWWKFEVLARLLGGER